MLDALYISAIGLRAQQEQLNAVANNFANLNTTAYKRQSVDFAAILDRAAVSQGLDALSSTGSLTSVDPSNPANARPNSLLRFDLSSGAIHATGRLLDMAVSGAGFIAVDLPGNRTGYSRGGSLQVNAEGGLSLPTGQALKADVRIPSGAGNVQILADGSVTATVPGETTARVVGQIELATFTNPDLLAYRGDGIYMAPDGMAEPANARPGEQGTEPLVPQSLEGSNVDMTTEMVSMTLMQRVYELNSRVAQVADEMMGMANNMRHE
jgi:flagellar basal-body rod protein FlgG